LREVEAGLARDEALARKAEADVVRYADLVKKDFVTKEQADLIKATAESLRATVAADRAAVDSARLQLSYCTITAPVAGRTGSLLVRAGNLVKANDDKVLVVINQMRPIFVSFAVPAEHMAAVRTGARDGLEVNAVIPGEDDRPVGGKLAVVDNAVDASTGTVLLKATFDNEGERLWPGLFVDVALVLEQQRDRLVVPAAAVQTGQIGTYVFVVKDDQTAELRPVKVVRQDEQVAVLSDGVQAGEMVVTDGQLRLVPGTRVEAGDNLAPRAEARS
ncbi:MAG TPA: efflux RND transporter periplasmic adaptor subunit, partial [Thermoanaerobaculaceae bacterium]|nr:efflux RND transporter periplasmic adaptor subunit [Thermoanaerobaculaceae bacterium]